MLNVIKSKLQTIYSVKKKKLKYDSWFLDCNIVRKYGQQLDLDGCNLSEPVGFGLWFGAQSMMPRAWCQEHDDLPWSDYLTRFHLYKVETHYGRDCTNKDNCQSLKVVILHYVKSIADLQIRICLIVVVHRL